jgi:hypothetical protein
MQYLDRTSGGSGGSLSDMAEGVMLATGEPTAVPVTQYFQFVRMVPDEGTDEGTVQAAISTFGSVGMEWQARAGEESRPPNVLWMQFRLRDSSPFSPELRDVTGHIDRIDLSYGIKLFIDAGYYRYPGDTLVVLPQVSPKDDGMFDAGIIDWGGETVIDSGI